MEEKSFFFFFFKVDLSRPIWNFFFLFLEKEFVLQKYKRAAAGGRTDFPGEKFRDAEEEKTHGEQHGE